MRHADPLDEMIGERVRTLRLEHGLSQTQLGVLIGASVHDMQLFETGERRIGAARLIRIARALAVDVGVLFGRCNGLAGRLEPPEFLRLALLGARSGPSRSIH